MGKHREAVKNDILECDIAMLSTCPVRHHPAGLADLASERRTLQRENVKEHKIKILIIL